MMTYNDSFLIAQELFASDNVFAMATSADHLPTVRMVDAFLEDGAFYIVTHSNTRKYQDIKENPNVSLSKEMHRFFGTATDLGHPFKEGNETIREKIGQVLPNRYFNRLDPEDESLRVLKIDLTTGFFHKNGVGYELNFEKKTVETYDIQFDLYT